MRRDQLEHAIRTACQIIGHPAVIIVGSQAILGSFGEDELGHRGEEHHPTGGPRSALAQVGDQCRSDVGRQGQQVDLADLPPELRDSAPTAVASDWESALAQEADRLLAGGEGSVHEKLTDRFERILITRALAHTGGRRIEAALALGIGRNTITRKIQELGLDAARGEESESA